MRLELNFPEWLSLFFFLIFATLSWLRPLEWKERLTITALGGVAIGLIFLPLMNFHPALLNLRPVVPVLLIPMAYWQTGRFRSPLRYDFQEILARMDQRAWVLLNKFQLSGRSWRWLRIYGEYAYVLCYPVIPSGLLVLYLAGEIDKATDVWSTVLPPAYVCYATLPFFRTLPPRLLETGKTVSASNIRTFNLIVVSHVTHEANTFPSGHAAAALALALALIDVTPTIGFLYLGIALSIMGGAFLGRYHYLIDVLIGAVLAIISFALCQMLTAT